MLITRNPRVTSAFGTLVSRDSLGRTPNGKGGGLRIAVQCPEPGDYSSPAGKFENTFVLFGNWSHCFLGHLMMVCSTVG